MAFDISEVLKDVSAPDTGREELAFIPYANLIPDPANSYSMDGIAGLARSIELVGLQQPLRVRQRGDGTYSILSGHRRHAAIGLLIAWNSKAFDAGVPCIIDRRDGSPAWRELQLLLGNADNRKMTPADELRTVEGVSDCIRKLEAEGFQFPGRHREWVARMVGMSNTRIARLQAIKKHLAASLLEHFNSGALPVTAAYRLSQESEQIQHDVFRTFGGRLKEMTEAQLEEAIARRHQPPKPDPHIQRIEPAPAGSFNAEAHVSDYLAKRAEEDQTFFRYLAQVSMPFIEILPDGCTRTEGIAALKDRYGRRWEHSGGPNMVCYDATLKGLSLYKTGKGPTQPIFRTWTEVYDLLATIAFQLAAQSGGPEAEKDEDPEQATATPAAPPAVDWITEGEIADGRYLCLVDMQTAKLHEQRCEWKAGQWLAYGQPIHELFSVKAWWPLPPETYWLYNHEPEEDDEEVLQDV